MEFFHGVNIDWMGKAKYFVALSLILLAVGWISVFHRYSQNPDALYGIDFRGGTLVYVRFAGKPPMEQIRKGLQDAGLATSTLQGISDTQNVGSQNDVVIGLEQSKGDESLDAGKQKILDVLHKTFGTESAAKPDFNSITPSALTSDLTQKDPLSLGTNAGDRYTQLATQLTDARDKDHDGIVTGFDQLQSVPGVTPAVLSLLANNYSLSTFAIRDAEIVGPKVGAQLRHQAFWATIYALGGMLVYIAFRFEWVYGAAAVIAVFHDVLITLGFFSLFHYEISLTVIAALLTLVGYSMNDTIVIFDRVRENLRLMKRESFKDIVNKSINQTLSRTILTSGLTFLTVLVLYLMGGEVLRAFSFAMVVGVVVGTYSSFGIAAPIVVLWNKYHGGQGSTVRAGSAAGKRAVVAARS
ncbi:MAG TPA: protein translocase subunit SecF [Candidatus Acidoferrales bacterium]|jgi:preprotein translocase subunit SecF|nr:protein translocase subunit SecF [Candidatus Acidoferrales bacterium]